jgi:hypothetical protein
MAKDPGKLLTGVRHPRLLYSRGAQAEDMEICGLHANTAICLKVGIPLSSPTDLPHPVPDRDGLPGWHPQFEIRINQEADPDGGWKPVPTETAIRQQFGSSSLLRFSAPILASPSYSGSSKPRIETDGTGMASALAFLALNRSEIGVAWSEIGPGHPGRLPAPGSHRSGLAQLRHPARHVTQALRGGTPSGPRSPAEAGDASGSD